MHDYALSLSILKILTMSVYAHSFTTKMEETMQVSRSLGEPLQKFSSLKKALSHAKSNPVLSALMKRAYEDSLGE